jgi:3-deoxy-7-phosphoheptulonate synthase
MVDPSHGTGKWRYVESMALAAVAAGTDALMIEVHPKPSEALTDGPQSLTPKNFHKMMSNLALVAQAVGRVV